MTRAPQLIVFSDLDGTLLDHDTYSWDAARPSLEALRHHNIPLVLVSSKTRAELQSLRAALGNHHPYIVENGAATYIPRGYFSDLTLPTGDNEEDLISAGMVRKKVIASLKQIRKDGGFRFQSFTELGADNIARLTGLCLEAAGNANDRAASEPLMWEDSESQLQEFSVRLVENGLRCVRGGRFVHVMGQFDKADAVARLTRLYAHKYVGTKILTVALGDGPNDLRMLAAADIAVVVKGKHQHDMTLESSSRVIHTTVPGPIGWNEAMLNIVSDCLPVA